MLIKSVEFIKSSANWKENPEPNLPEYAFIGRSNVGKSSLINMLMNQKKLAKTSSTPGKTKLINHFLVNEQWYLTDLPGYGYAKVSKKDRKVFAGIITHYILERKNLVNLYVLVDSRHEPMKIDLEFMEWLGESQIPFTIVFTKVDKIGRDKFNFNFKSYQKKLREFWEELPPILISSATEGIGKDELLSHINDINIQLKKDKIVF